MSNPLILYFGSGSPYAWKVWLALEHKKLPYEAKRMHFENGDLKTPEFTAINPRRKVPALVDNGFAMYESAAILEYLEDRYPDSGEPLWPRDVQARAVARRRAAEVVAYVDTRKPGYHLLALVPPKLAAWMRRIEALPYFEKTVPLHWTA